MHDVDGGDALMVVVYWYWGFVGEFLYESWTKLFISCDSMEEEIDQGDEMMNLSLQCET